MYWDPSKNKNIPIIKLTVRPFHEIEGEFLISIVLILFTLAKIKKECKQKGFLRFEQN